MREKVRAIVTGIEVISCIVLFWSIAMDIATHNYMKCVIWSLVALFVSIGIDIALDYGDEE